MTTTSERQARTILARHEETHPVVRDWITNPTTGAERQAAALLTAPKVEKDDERSATERQAAYLLG